MEKYIVEYQNGSTSDILDSYDRAITLSKEYFEDRDDFVGECTIYKLEPFRSVAMVTSFVIRELVT